MASQKIDFDNLGFNYIKTDYRYLSYWKEGDWDDGALVTDNQLHISEGSTALHYGQQCFEGLKAYRCKDGSINIFRPDQNALRMQHSCSRLLMPLVPVEVFVEACRKVVLANEHFIPPYGSGGALYLRPFLIGVGHNIGVKTAAEFLFSIYCVPVGDYFKGGLTPHQFLVSDYDRAAPNGTGATKTGGNYAASLVPSAEAKQRQFTDCIYLDPLTHSKIEEVGSANFFAITEKNEFITPASSSVLPGITLSSLKDIAQSSLGMEVIEGDIFIDDLGKYKEAGACGTAAVITPIGCIEYQDNFHIFHSLKSVGPVTQRLYRELTGIQSGDIKAPGEWIVKV
ncbi:branched-chain amino acid aminotransferase [Pseudomonas sp. 6D_7.1_Bac1]|uniref:branched-chain amino acid aminotransferase n=1 Tax=Pseudomonas sp. 6D_7.1_Bac1 TaxID=2971615 RepID=UPI0021C8CAA4|nr:branched-chain amino acid aminotransferase [Pseudomonas sp. 6D_7.1_Bac1]MCU1751844.1 branched-chain amino acid aminotransferase [Pseudomonas sp. 6D_7.1_Bac1]